MEKLAILGGEIDPEVADTHLPEHRQAVHRVTERDGLDLGVGTVKHTHQGRVLGRVGDDGGARTRVLDVRILRRPIVDVDLAAAAAHQVVIARVQRGLEDPAGLEVADDGQVQVLPRNAGVEAAHEKGLGAVRDLVVGVDGAGRGTVGIVVAVVLDLDHTERSLVTGDRIHLAGLEDVHIRIILLPEAVIFIVIDALERITDEPAVALVLGRTVRKGDQLVPVGVQVQAGIPAPIAAFDEGTVDRELDTPVPGGADVGRGAGHTGR